MSIRVINVIHLCIKTTKFVINPENLSLTKAFLFFLTLFKFLELKMPPKSFNNNDFLRIISNSRVCFGLESTLFEFFEFLLAALLGNAQMLFL